MEDVVVPVRRVVQRDPGAVDHLAPSVAEQAPVEQQLGRPRGGLSRVGVAGGDRVYSCSATSASATRGRRVPRPRAHVAVPAAVGPLRSQKQVDQRPHPRIRRESEPAAHCLRVALLRRAAAHAARDGADERVVLGAVEPCELVIDHPTEVRVVRRDLQLDKDISRQCAPSTSGRGASPAARKPASMRVATRPRSVRSWAPRSALERAARGSSRHVAGRRRRHSWGAAIRGPSPRTRR